MRRNTRYRSRTSLGGFGAFGFAFVGVGLLILGFVVFSIWASFGTVETVTIKVKDKERVTQGSGDTQENKYLVFTEDETFENTDAMLHGKFNSSDLYGKLDKGKSYECKVNGYRVGFMSSYRNLLECSPA